MTSYLCGKCRDLAINHWGASRSDFSTYSGSEKCDGVDVPNEGIYNDHGHAKAQYKGSY